MGPSTARVIWSADQSGPLDGAFQVGQPLAAGAADPDFVFGGGPAGFRAGFGGGGNNVAVEDVIAQVLLEIALGVEFEHLAHVGDREEGHFRAAQDRVFGADGQGDLARLGFEPLDDAAQVLGEQALGNALFRRWARR